MIPSDRHHQLHEEQRDAVSSSITPSPPIRFASFWFSFSFIWRFSAAVLFRLFASSFHRVIRWRLTRFRFRFRRFLRRRRRRPWRLLDWRLHRRKFRWRVVQFRAHLVLRIRPLRGLHTVTTSWRSSHRSPRRKWRGWVGRLRIWILEKKNVDNYSWRQQSRKTLTLSGDLKKKKRKLEGYSHAITHKANTANAMQILILSLSRLILRRQRRSGVIRWSYFEIFDAIRLLIIVAFFVPLFRSRSASYDVSNCLPSRIWPIYIYKLEDISWHNHHQLITSDGPNYGR